MQGAKTRAATLAFRRTAYWHLAEGGEEIEETNTAGNDHRPAIPQHHDRKNYLPQLRSTVTKFSGKNVVDDEDSSLFENGRLQSLVGETALSKLVLMVRHSQKKPYWLFERTLT